MDLLWCSQTGRYCEEFGEVCATCKEWGAYWQVCGECGKSFYGCEEECCDECLRGGDVLWQENQN